MRIADYYLLHRLPTDEDKLQLDDHGCEIIGGLAEVYFLAAQTDTVRRERYRPAMHKLLDRVLEVGRNADGFFYDSVDPRTGTVLSSSLTDNWGYNYNAFLTVAELDDHAPYRDAVLGALRNLPTVADYKWENGGADGYADSIEGAINLLNRLPVDVGFEWVNHSAAIMLAMQRADGIIEGWHGDGNYARTAIMYALWKTKGITIRPWRPDVAVGAEEGGDGTLYVVVQSDWPWTGKLTFDRPRHRDYLRLPVDYPRLNQFPEWFTVDENRTYDITIDGQKANRVAGKGLIAGLEVKTARGQAVRITASR